MAFLPELPWYQGCCGGIDAALRKDDVATGLNPAASHIRFGHGSVQGSPSIRMLLRLGSFLSWETMRPSKNEGADARVAPLLSVDAASAAWRGTGPLRRGFLIALYPTIFAVRAIVGSLLMLFLYFLRHRACHNGIFVTRWADGVCVLRSSAPLFPMCTGEQCVQAWPVTHLQSRPAATQATSGPGYRSVAIANAGEACGRCRASCA
jgi:hypothetical protein